MYLVRKDNIDEGSPSFMDDELNIRGGGRARNIQDIMPVEARLIKQVVNLLALWLWKRAV